MVRLSAFKKDIMTYYSVVNHIWTTKDYHCINVYCYDEENKLILDHSFYDFDEYLDYNNNKEYDTIEIDYDPITIQFPTSSIKNLR